MDYEPTAKAIEQCAQTLEDYARELRRHAQDMREKQDFEYAQFALAAIKNCFGNVRTELLVARPLREYQKQNPGTLR